MDVLARAYWGGEYNGEVKRLMFAHAFRFRRDERGQSVKPNTCSTIGSLYMDET
jgi:hypothetical protein